MHTGPRSLRLTFLPGSPAPLADETLLHVAYGGVRQQATDAGLELALPPLGSGSCGRGVYRVSCGKAGSGLRSKPPHRNRIEVRKRSQLR